MKKFRCRKAPEHVLAAAGKPLYEMAEGVGLSKGPAGVYLDTSKSEGPMRCRFLANAKGELFVAEFVGASFEGDNMQKGLIKGTCEIYRIEEEVIN